MGRGADGAGPRAAAGAGRERPKRTRAAVNGGKGYDEVGRRRKAKKARMEARYVERRKGERRGELKNGIVVGPVTVERIVRGRYEWRDAAYARMSGERRGRYGKGHGRGTRDGKGADET